MSQNARTKREEKTDDGYLAILLTTFLRKMRGQRKMEESLRKIGQREIQNELRQQKEIMQAVKTEIHGLRRDLGKK